MSKSFIPATRLLGMLMVIMPAFIVLQSHAQEKTATYYADPAAIPPDLVVSLKHLTASVKFKPAENRVIGVAEFSFITNRYETDSMVFHCPDFIVSDVKVDGKEVHFYQAGPGLIITLREKNNKGEKLFLAKGTKHMVKIEYEATPKAGPIYFVGWRPEERGKRKAIWAHRPHGWLPYMDARITMDILVTTDRQFKVFSNGERVEIKDNPDTTRTWHYVMTKDHPYFSTALVIGDYDFQQTKTGRGIPVEYWYYAGMKDRVEPTYRYTLKMFDFFEQDMGFPYPYPVYREAPVIDYIYGAMETTTSTVFGDYMFIDPRAWWQRNYVNVNAHELAHQWFGNCIGHFVNRDVWLTESFGTYYAKVFERFNFGDDYYQNIRNDEVQLVFDAAKKNSYPVGGSQGGVQRIYQKGSLVLDMLRDVMGDKPFRDAIRLYLERFAFSNTETGDFIRCTYDATGKSYAWFFDQWILRGGEPHYRVGYTVSDDTAGQRSTLIRVAQIQETSELSGLFKMPVRFEIHYTDKSSDTAVSWISEKFSEISIPNPGKKRIAFVLFDPNRHILKKVTFDRGFSELAAQALDAPDMIDRYDALLALRPFPTNQKRDLLVRVYAKERFHLTKSEVLLQLSGDNTPESMEVFREALTDRDAHVRKTALAGLDAVPDLLRAAVEDRLTDSSYLNVELALDVLASSFPEDIDRYLALTENDRGWRGLNIRMKWLEIAIATGRDSCLQELIAYSGPVYEFETRMNALTLLKKMRYIDDATIHNARLASKHWNNKLGAVGREYLNYFAIRD
jgi:aminopeptidase N